MKKTCLHCSEVFYPQRNTKKYCSDNCKQLAYYKRHGFSLSPLTWEDSPNVTLKQEQTLNNTVKPDENDFTFDDKAINALADKLMLLIELKIEHSIAIARKNVKEQLNVKEPFNVKQEHFTLNDKTGELSGENKEPVLSVVHPLHACKPCETLNVKRYEPFNVKSEAKVIPLNGNYPVQSEITTDDKQQDQEFKIIELADDEQAQQEQVNEKNQDKKAVEKNVTTAIITNQEPAKEEPYQWVQSKFINKVADYLDGRHEDIKFLYPEKFWSENTIQYVKWITLRLRCLIESLIKLSNYSYIDKHTLLELHDAFSRLSVSEYFKYLPEDYPYTALIIELQEKMKALAEENKNTENIRFRLSPNRKAALTAKRFEIGNFVPRIKFSQLDFDKQAI